LDRGYRMTELLKQGLHQPMHVTDQVIMIFVGTRGHLDDVPMDQVRAWERDFLQDLRTHKHALWQRITDSRDLSDESRSELERAISEFKQQRAGQRRPAARTPEKASV
jgi:F-type H+-transporting ATPase subunit alpha